MSDEERARDVARGLTDAWGLTGAAPRLLRTLANNEFVGVYCSKPVTVRALWELYERRLIEKPRPAEGGLVVKHGEVTGLGRLVAQSLKD